MSNLPQVDINLTCQETPLLRQIIAQIVNLFVKKNIRVDWWAYHTSPHCAKVMKDMTPENRLKFELEWRMITRRGTVKPWVMSLFTPNTAITQDKEATARAAIYGASFWVYNECAGERPGFEPFKPNPQGYGVLTAALAEDIEAIVLTSARFMLSIEGKRIIALRIDSAPVARRLEDDPELAEMKTAINTGQFPGASMVYEDNGELYQAPCRSLDTPGIIIGSQSGTMYQRNPDGTGALRRIGPKASQIRKGRT